MKHNAKRRKFGLSIVPAFAAVICALSLSGILTGAVLAVGTGFDAVTIEESYAYGQTFTVPEVRVDQGGESVTATHILTFPDGTATTDTVAVLDRAGKYTLEYTAGSEKKSYDFRVDYPLVVTGANSSAVISEYNGIRGLRCRVLCGDTMTFSEPLDISDLRAASTLFKMFLLPTESGVPGFAGVEIVLTDLADANNTVRIVTTQSRSDPATYSYTKAAAAGQPLTGYEVNRGKLWVGGIYGAPATFGWLPTADYEKNTLAFTFDPKEKQVYANGNFVIDFDDPAYFGTLWQGFGSDLVRLSVKPQSGTVAEFFVTDVFGNDFAADTVRDEEAPTVTVDTMGYGKSAPDAIVGKPWPIFPVSAFDRFEGPVDVTTRVYRNYNSSSKVRIDLRDGAFTPDRAASYTVEYTAKDMFGNSAVETVSVRAKNAADVPAIVLTPEGGDRTAVAGTVAQLATFTASGGSGKVAVTVTVSDGQGTEKPAEKEFLAWSSGIYTVHALGTDYIGNTAESSYTVEVAPNPIPVFEDTIVPEYLIAGVTYRLPELWATDYGKNPAQRIRATVSVSGSAASVSDGTFAPTEADAGKEITVTYTAQGVSGSAEKTYTSTVISVLTNGVTDLSKYFIAKDATLRTDSDGVVATVEETAELQFVNAVLWQDFALTFKPGKKVGITTITLTGYQNPNEVLRFAFVQTGSLVSIRVNGGDSLETGQKTGISQSLIYADGRYTGCGQTINVQTFADGTPFEGFTGDKVMVSLSVSDLSDTTAGLRIQSLNGQKFSDDDGDYVGPQILLLGEYGGTHAVGSRVETVEAVASDVLGGAVTLMLSVYGPSGTPVTAADGTKLSDIPYGRYAFDCDEYGTYEVTYTATDVAGNTQNASYVVNIVNRIPPTVTLSAAFPATVSAGKEFRLPAVTVTDDLTAAEDVILSIVLRRPDGVCVTVTGDRLTLTRKGAYTITYMALDADGNASFLDIEFSVK